MTEPERPFFSVVIPVFNNAEYLSETIQSVIDQSIPDWELIIIDDGSKDNSLEISNSFKEEYKNIQVLTHPEGKNKGVSASRNLGISNSKGAWIAFLDGDDVWYKEKLEAIKETILEHNYHDFGFIYSTSRIIDENGDYIDKKSESKDYNFKFGIHGRGRPGISYEGFRWAIKSEFEASTPSVVVRKDILNELGGFDENLTYSEDAILWYRIIEKNSFYFIDKPLLNIRVHKNSWNAGANRELKISRRFVAYEYLLKKVKRENKKYIQKLLINTGLKIIIRNYSGIPDFHPRLILSYITRVWDNKDLNCKTKLMSILILLQEVVIIPVRLIKKIFSK